MNKFWKIFERKDLFLGRVISVMSIPKTLPNVDTDVNKAITSAMASNSLDIEEAKVVSRNMEFAPFTISRQFVARLRRYKLTADLVEKLMVLFLEFLFALKFSHLSPCFPNPECPEDKNASPYQIDLCGTHVKCSVCFVPLL
jgi:hypothetical protein